MQYASEFTTACIAITMIDMLLEYLEHGYGCSHRKVFVRVVKFWFGLFARVIVGSFFTR